MEVTVEKQSPKAVPVTQARDKDKVWAKKQWIDLK